MDRGTHVNRSRSGEEGEGPEDKGESEAHGG